MKNKKPNRFILCRTIDLNVQMKKINEAIDNQNYIEKILPRTANNE
jgi:hypothetical protein